MFQNRQIIRKLSLIGCRNLAMLSNNVSSNIKLSVLGNGALLQPSLYLTSDKYSYMFNCGEGIQRMILSHSRSVKLNFYW